MNNAHQLFRHVFGGQRGLMAIVTVKRDADGGWDNETVRTRYFDFPGQLQDACDHALAESRQGKESYYCAHLLADKRRVKEYAADVAALWGDLDGAELPNGNKTPTAVVESSPGRYHVSYRLTDPIPAETAEMLNKRLAHDIGADPSGFDRTQLLRVPGTTNYKHADRPEVKVVRLDGTQDYVPGELDKMLPPLPKSRNDHARRDTTGEPPVALSEAALKVWRGEDPKLREDGQVDRSSTLLKMGRALFDAGATRSAIIPALIERDATLGWHKTADRDAEEYFAAIVDELESNGRNRRIHITRNGSKHNSTEVPEDRPQVVINGRHLNEVTTDAMTAVLAANDPPHIFIRTGTMTRVVLDEDGTPTIQRLTESALRGRMDRVAEFVRVNKDRESEAIVPANPPKIVVEDAMALDRWDGLPPIEAIVETPILRPDGTIFEDAGYDSETRLYYHPAAGFEMPAVSKSPSKGEVDEALAVVDDAIGEFPFADEASAANARALLLTPIIRQAVQGCVPLALIDKPQMGTGGSLFAEVASYIGIGRHAEMLGQPAHEDEWRKTITAKLDAGASMVTIDNVDDPLTSSNLSRALTARTWTDRRLGRSEEITLAQRATWLATGNNIELGGDIARRCYWIRMDAKQAKPWQRQNFKHPDLKIWVESHRGDLVHALLTIARYWYAAGCPKDESLPRLGSFEGWAETVGGMLAHAGIKGFLSNLDELYESADSQTEEWTGFLETWREKVGAQSLTAKSLAENWILKDGEFKTSLPEDLAATLDEGSATFARTLGNTLKKVAGRRHGERGLYVHKHGTYKRSVKWKVSESGTPDGEDEPPDGESSESGESLSSQRCSFSAMDEEKLRENELAVDETDSPDSLDSPPSPSATQDVLRVARPNVPNSYLVRSTDGAVGGPSREIRGQVYELFQDPPKWLSIEVGKHTKEPGDRLVGPISASVAYTLGYPPNAVPDDVRLQVERELEAERDAARESA